MVDSPRLKEFDYSGQSRSYFVTARFDARQDASVRSSLLTTLLVLFDETDFMCDALVIMPDHFHLVTTKETDSESNLSDLMCTLKSKSLHIMKQDGSVVSSFWQRGYYDHIIRNEADLTEKVSYVIANPTKAGLSGSPEVRPNVYCKDFWAGATQGRPLRGYREAPK